MVRSGFVAATLAALVAALTSGCAGHTKPESAAASPLPTTASCATFVTATFEQEASLITRLGPTSSNSADLARMLAVEENCYGDLSQTVTAAIQDSGRLVNVYLTTACGLPEATPSDCLTPAQLARIGQTLNHLGQVQSSLYISPAAGFQRFKLEFRNEPKLIKQTPRGAIPASFAVVLRTRADFGAFDAIVRGLPGVESVNQAPVPGGS